MAPALYRAEMPHSSRPPPRRRSPYPPPQVQEASATVNGVAVPRIARVHLECAPASDAAAHADPWLPLDGELACLVRARERAVYF